jgi:hypothetical protein
LSFGSRRSTRPTLSPALVALVILPSLAGCLAFLVRHAFPSFALFGPMFGGPCLTLFAHGLLFFV